MDQGPWIAVVASKGVAFSMTRWLVGNHKRGKVDGRQQGEFEPAISFPLLGATDFPKCLVTPSILLVVDNWCSLIAPALLVT
jgi:hypothetical protein